MSAALAIAAAALTPLAAPAAPTLELQNLRWFVPAELPDSLATYQAAIDAALLDARRLVQGDQGPADVPCCADLRRLSIGEPSAPTLVLVDGAADFDTMTTLCELTGGGSCAFLVSSITWCGAPGVGILGCADQPACNQNAPNDDPTLVLAVGLQALQEPGGFAQTLAHERGHNACLQHVPTTSNPCSLMQPVGGGGCLSAAECGRLRDAGNAEQGTCACHTDVSTTAEGVCSDVAGGMCSGGVCVARSEAAARLLAAGGPEAATGGFTDEPLRMAAGSGGWTDVGGFDAEIRALEEAPSRGVVYGITAADELVTVDPDTGARLATIGALPATAFFAIPTSATQAATYEALAFDPGATAGLGDDRLWALRIASACASDADCDARLVSIDPDDAATVEHGPLTLLFPGRRFGLGFDAARGALFASIPYLGLHEVDASCVGTPGCSGCCETTDTGVALVRSDAALAYDAAGDQLWVVGTDLGDRASIEAFDAATFEAALALGIDAFTPGALAAPEPRASLLGAASLALLSFARRRSRGSPRRAARRSC